jgi:prepilin-type N-terminal cleavage/methylation domain-containing protein
MSHHPNTRITLKNARKAFTLVEIMIVVLIIGILLGIAVPNFTRARAASRQKTCISNLRAIRSATEQWVVDARKKNNDPVEKTELIGPTLYIKTEPRCPTTNAIYNYMNVGDNPRCANPSEPDGIIGINHRMGDWN